MAAQKVKVYLLRPKDRPTLQLQWTDPDTGARKTESAGTTDPEVAEDARADREYELNHGLYQERCRLSWVNFRKLYLEERLAGCREATKAKAGYVFDKFEKIVRPRLLGAITERTLSKYAATLREQGYKAPTIHGHLAYIRAALRWAADQKFFQTPPKVVMPKLPKKGIIRKIVAEEFERLLNKAPNEQWRIFLQTAWYTGMRRNEMLSLTWDGSGGQPWVDLSAKRIILPAAWNKSGADQSIPIHPELKAILLPVHRSKGLVFQLSHSPREVSRSFTKLAKAAGLRITLHDLRRSFGSRYACVVTAPQLQRLMRHADIKTTLTYYTDVDDSLDQAICKLGGPLNSSPNGALEKVKDLGEQNRPKSLSGSGEGEIRTRGEV